VILASFCHKSCTEVGRGEDLSEPGDEANELTKQETLNTKYQYKQRKTQLAINTKH
jgi:hypothetical protein